jgi:VIT1/CCC1 family predicted Fe2+/Mn2+ transporter
MKISTQLKDALLRAQRNEITEHHIYRQLAAVTAHEANRTILQNIADDEKRHYEFWRRFTGQDLQPNSWQLKKYYFISRVFGLTFGIKLMEQGEKQAQINYQTITKELPEAADIEKDEEQHENKLISLINEEKLQYIGSVVLGLNDALVELTGALAGLTLALQNSRLIAMAGLITGIAASLSMAVSEYLSTKTEGGEKNPLKAALYTGIAYIGTVMLLILSYLVIPNLYFALIITLLLAISVIFVFTFYLSVAKDLSFKRRFAEMALLSLSVAAVSFGIGYLVRLVFSIEV